MRALLIGEKPACDLGFTYEATPPYDGVLSVGSHGKDLKVSRFTQQNARWIFSPPARIFGLPPETERPMVPAAPPMPPALSAPPPHCSGGMTWI